MSRTGKSVALLALVCISSWSIAATPALADIVNVTPPVLSGTPEPGETLSCSDGTWSEQVGPIYKTWRRDGDVFFGGSGNTYLVTESDVGRNYSCIVRAVSDETESSEDMESNSVTIQAKSLPPVVDPPTTPPTTPSGPSGPPPTVAKPPKVVTPLPPSTSVIEFPSGGRSCKSRRSFKIRIRKYRDLIFTSASVWVNGKRVKVVKQDRLRAPVNLKGLPYGTFKVKIMVTTSDQRTLQHTRKFRTCRTKKLPGKKHRL